MTRDADANLSSREKELQKKNGAKFLVWCSSFFPFVRSFWQEIFFIAPSNCLPLLMPQNYPFSLRIVILLFLFRFLCIKKRNKKKIVLYVNSIPANKLFYSVDSLLVSFIRDEWPNYLWRVHANWPSWNVTLFMMHKFTDRRPIKKYYSETNHWIYIFGAVSDDPSLKTAKTTLTLAHTYTYTHA